MRIAVLFDNFGPYHLARLNAASSYANILGVEVHAKSDVYDWGVSETAEYLKHVVLFKQGSSVVYDRSTLFGALDRAITPFRPDVIAVPGWSSPAAIMAVDWAYQHGIATIVMSESNRSDFSRSPLSEWTKRQLISRFGGGLCGGEQQKQYLVSLGMKSSNVFVGYDVIDNDYFANQAREVRAAGDMPYVGRDHRLNETWRGRYFLASARFIKKKNLDGLLRAYAGYRTSVFGKQAWPLVLLGDGILRPELEVLRRELALEDHVFMPGFRQYDELPWYYATAGAFVHASTTEQWGLVVNEAMASGLPVLVSDCCGCASELVEDGSNGYRFDPNDCDKLAALMTELSSDDELRSTMSKQSLQIIAGFSPDRFARGLQDAAQAAMSQGVGGQRIISPLLSRSLAWYQARRLRKGFGRK